MEPLTIDNAKPQGFDVNSTLSFFGRREDVPIGLAAIYGYSYTAKLIVLRNLWEEKRSEDPNTERLRNSLRSFKFSGQLGILFCG